MTVRRLISFLAATVALFVFLSKPASASVHLMQIEQVIGGVNGDTTAQAIQLRMRFFGQNFLAPTRIRVWDANGLNPIIVVNFPTSVSNGSPGARVLIASASFVGNTTPPANPDFTLSNLIPQSYLAAGSMTFETDSGVTIYWRLSWGGGSYTGLNTGSFNNDANGNFGPPFPGPLPSSGVQALLFQGTASALSTTNAADYALTAGEAVFNNNSGTSFTLGAPPGTGACCDDASGSCTITTQVECNLPGTRYGGDDSTCANLDPPCVAPTGACCDDATGSCAENLTQFDCELVPGSRYGGDDSTCANIDPPCLAPTGACCDDAAGSCVEDLTQFDCELVPGSRYGGDNSTCATINPPCEPQTGACCDGGVGVCTETTTQTDCEDLGRRYGGDGSDCESIDPPCVSAGGACCDETTGNCTDNTSQVACEELGFRYGGDGSDCSTIDPVCIPPLPPAIDISLQVVADGLVAPLSLTHANDESGRLFIVDQAGQIRIVQDDVLLAEPFLDISDKIVELGTIFDERGFLGLAFHPEYPSNGRFFVRYSAPRPISISLEVVATGLISPLIVTHAGDGSGRLFVVDQAGQIQIIDNGKLLPTPFLDLSDKLVELSDFFDERGLLGLAFHPDYASNGRFFVRYSRPREGDPQEPCNDPGGFNVGCHTAVLAEFAVSKNPDIADPKSEIILLEVDEPQFNHNAGGLAFGSDGFLYIALGDGGGANDSLDVKSLPHGKIGNGQNIETLLGALLRIDVDSKPAPKLAYAIPPDNPFVGLAGRDEIYAYGFRNPFRFSFDDGPGGDNRLYLGDVGQDIFEEVDIVELGGNYGWVIKEGAHCFDPFNPGEPPEDCPDVGPMGEPLIDPVSEYTHAEGGLSVIGGFVYRGSQFPELVGRYVHGDFSADFGPTGRLYYFDLEGSTAFQRQEFIIRGDENTFAQGQFLKGFGEDENGELYVCASDQLPPMGLGGAVYRIVRPDPPEPCADPNGFIIGCHREVLAEYSVSNGDPNLADPDSEIILFSVDEPEFNHDAGDIAFGPDGFLYFPLGDGGGANDGLGSLDLPHGPTGNGQNIETFLGSMLRIDVDGDTEPNLPYAIPDDNPFVDQAGLDEIYAYGFRNPYKFSFDDGPGGDGALYLGDVGQNLFEEVDIVVNGGNYGWPIKEGANCFDPFEPDVPPLDCPDVGPFGEPLVDPVSEYTQEDGGISVIGGFVYRGSRFSELVGKYVYGDFSAQFFVPGGRLYYFDTQGPHAFIRREFGIAPTFLPFGQFLKGFGEDGDGDVYVCASDELAPVENSGVVYRIAPVATCVLNADCDDANECTFDRCQDGACSNVDGLYADVASADGSCGPDGTIGLPDILVVLDGFRGFAPKGCEPFNVDFAGQGGSCGSDGDVTLLDILAVLNAFQGMSSCCP